MKLPLGIRSIQRPTLSRRSTIMMLSLVVIFSAALIMRSYPAKYGFYLSEFDPYYDYYASKYIVDNFDSKGIAGILNYFTWQDTTTWYPEGRPVASSSQDGLHFAGAILYLIARNLFGLNTTLYNFLVLFPVFAGALTTLAMYLLVKKISGGAGGLFAALIFAFSPPIIQRGALGWFKSEPLALLLTITASYLFISIYDAKTSSTSLLWRSAIAGALLGYANTSWGGSQYFSIVAGLLLIIIPFFKIDLKKTAYAGVLLVSTDLIVSSIFPRPGPSIITGPVGLLLIFSAIFITLAYKIRSAVEPDRYRRTLFKMLFTLALIGLVLLSFGAVTRVSGRYLTVVYPFQRTANPLIESVAEHFVPTGADYFASYAILLFLAGFGAIIAFRRRTVPYIFALILGLSGIYLASSFSRLMVYSSIAVAVLASIGFVELTSSILKPSVIVAAKKKARIYGGRTEMKIIYSIFMISLITLPTVYPSYASWIDVADTPVALANGGTNFRATIPDWIEALEWIRDNTPQYQADGKPTVIASWWDYGYWITVMGNRTSLADNATINQTRIAELGRMFMSDDTDGWKILMNLKADYVLIFVAGQKFQDPSTGQPIYILGGGGDESKKQWFIRIGGLNISQYLYEDEFTPKPYFWDNTLLGKMLPFKLLQYIDQTGKFVGEDWQRGYQAVYYYSEKYPSTGEGPLRLVFKSSGITKPFPSGQRSDIFASVLIYEVVKDWEG